ncbi:STAS domain-containing protein [Actinomadura kijaniata]|uniref:STAS domain-containing protein n=1 Tax=Actinomadura kijaniata TaxID=46161 RepID=UPI003F1AA25C
MDDNVSFSPRTDGAPGALPDARPDGLRLSTWYSGDTCTLTVIGVLDYASGPQMHDCLDGLFARLGHRDHPHERSGDGGGERGDRSGDGLFPSRLVLEVGGVSFIDAVGLGVLVAARSQADRHHVRLFLGHVPARMHRLLVLTGLDHRFLYEPCAPG